MRRVAVVLGAVVVAFATPLGASAVGAAPALTLAVHPATSPTGGPAWLFEINRYREAAGLAPVTDQPAWDAGLQDHLTYLALTPPQYFTGQYQSLHTENPASPYYTAAGAHEAGSSNLMEGAVGLTPVQVIDMWLQAPFHAVGILRPGLTQVAFAYDPTTGDGGLDVISGLTSTATDPNPVLFPGPGMATNLSTFGGEYPDPLQTCGWSGRSTGLPLVALLPSAPAAGLTASLVTPNGTVESTANGQLCVVDANTYYSSDPVYGPTGGAILSGDNAVFLIPAQPLVPSATSATFTATISQPGRATISWSFNDAPFSPGSAVGMATTADGGGYWLANAQGQVSILGDATYHGSASSLALAAPIIAMAATPDGGGYWLLGADGGIFTFGDAHFYGSTGAMRLNQPVVGMAPTRDGKGYWLVAADGGIFSFGDAHFYGSTGALHLNQPVVGMSRSATGHGYRLVAADGGIFSFGDATFYGSLGGTALPAPVATMAESADGAGYYMLGADASVYAFGDAVYRGGD